MCSFFLVELLYNTGKFRKVSFESLSGVTTLQCPRSAWASPLEGRSLWNHWVKPLLGRRVKLGWALCPKERMSRPFAFCKGKKKVLLLGVCWPSKQMGSLSCLMRLWALKAGLPLLVPSRWVKCHLKHGVLEALTPWDQAWWQVRAPCLMRMTGKAAKAEDTASITDVQT